ncbi:DcaP family trimeric outer membrane transporter [Teredinibacter sp. KSP-S5-2]|uniref:DcaP family trimeric outer membrane transporter n=1 Tax=Teredinibacter sp. KSP-S5-2 TaxID=3034506 RepID=UPI00293475E0|nr:DcaP family trimeric outer membrane transporter [Teredinibacter sp. KSP-S5-2]WNO11107.1 DcaP family trimeric outer membrane transporter [Teredinibacter sp. KSP-S5-2]
MVDIKKTVLHGGLIAAGMLGASLAQAVELGTYNNTKVKVGGYLKLDAMFTELDEGTWPANAWYRDFYVPSTVPVESDTTESEGMTFDMHARQSRFNLGTETEIDGHTLKTYIEMDFMTTSNGNERVSNSYSPRLRHAFLTYDNWLFGQTWSTFQNVGALPETVDFIGNTDFGIFVRQTQIRYTAGDFQFSIENPETTITPNDGGARIVADDNPLPDFVARHNLTAGGLNLTTAVLVRQLAYNNEATAVGDEEIDSTTTSYGLSVSGKYAFGKDDIRFGINTGKGMGRYIGLNVANGAVIDDNGDLEAIDSTAVYVAYRHFWSDKWRSNFTYSAIDIDNDTDLTGEFVTSSTESYRANIFFSPVKNLSFGGELALANREIETGAEGSMTRVQFTAKLAF